MVGCGGATVGIITPDELAGGPLQVQFSQYRRWVVSALSDNAIVTIAFQL